MEQCNENSFNMIKESQAIISKYKFRDLCKRGYVERITKTNKCGDTMTVKRYFRVSGMHLSKKTYLYDIKSTRERLGVTMSTIRNWCACGYLPHLSIDGEIYVKMSWFHKKFGDNFYLYPCHVACQYYGISPKMLRKRFHNGKIDGVEIASKILYVLE